MFLKKISFFTFSVRKNLLSIFIVAFTILLVVFSNSNLSAAKDGLNLWIKSVVPALFPFFIATELLSKTNIIPILGKYLNNFMRPVFNVPGEGSFAFIMGIISGYPVGAKILTKFRQDNICTKEECERLLSFTNNSGPLFILGTVGISLFGDTTTGIILFITHILACISVGIIFRFWKCNSRSKTASSSYIRTYNNKYNISFSNFGTVLTESISNSISTITMIGGFITLFSVIICIIKNSHLVNLISFLLLPIFNFLGIPTDFLDGFTFGIIELTNGLKIISSINIPTFSINIIIAAFLLGFGGFSVLLQVYGIISKTDISILPYFLGKLLHGGFSALYTYLILFNFKFLNLDLVDSKISYNIFILLFILALLFIFTMIIKLKKHGKITHN